jgi:hypothetical protein
MVNKGSFAPADNRGAYEAPGIITLMQPGIQVTGTLSSRCEFFTSSGYNGAQLSRIVPVASCLRVYTLQPFDTDMENKAIMAVIPDNNSNLLLYQKILNINPNSLLPVTYHQNIKR